jgi:hypothetical protein
VSSAGDLRRDQRLGRPARLLKTAPNSTGRIYVSLRDDDGKQRRPPLAELVATAFIANPDSLRRVRHRNEDLADCRAENLEWVARPAKTAAQPRDPDLDLGDWRPIKGYEGAYSVSADGRVRSEERSMPHWRGGQSTLKARLLKPGIWTDGGTHVTLYRDGKQQQKRVARLVADAFVANPDDLPMVRHRDDDPTNDDATNLEWYRPGGDECANGHSLDDAIIEGGRRKCRTCAAIRRQREDATRKARRGNAAIAEAHRAIWTSDVLDAIAERVTTEAGQHPADRLFWATLGALVDTVRSLG